MAPAVSSSLLFHPKAKKDAKRSTPLPERKAPSATPPKTRARPQGEAEAALQLPDVPFQEFRLMSSALNGWRYDVMKFDSRKPVDISAWQAPIKLNRKEPRREDGAGGGAPVAVGPMLGADGKPVIGVDGKVVMLDAEGRPIHVFEEGSGSKGKGGLNNGRKKFQKKTRQVFLVPEATRQLRREERHPWVMEDSSQKEVWVGKLEEVSKSETHAFFMPAANDIFKFVPAHRWYKFQKKPNYHIPSLEEAESIMAKHQKNKDPERWLLHNRNGKAPSAATAAVFKAETEGRVVAGANSHSGQSLGPGGRKLKTVDSGMDDLFEEGDDGAPPRRRPKNGGEGDVDEMEYEEDFADDEEKVEDENDDEEAKELEERLKREYKNANKQREGYVDESEEEDDSQLTRDGKAMKKLIRNLEKNNAYESDDEKNPYASSEEEEEEEEAVPVINEPAIQPQPQPQPSAPAPVSTLSGSQTPKTQPGSPARVPGVSTNGSRASSPAPSGLGGHSVVAKRATSPKARGSSSTVVSTGSRATSPLGTASPTAGGNVLKPSNKRKAAEDGAGGVAGVTGGSAMPKTKKRKGTMSHGTGSIPNGELEDRMVIDWLRNTPNATTRDCIQHFTPYLTDEAKKSKFTALVKEVAQLKGGVLVLRNAFRGGSGAPSPA